MLCCQRAIILWMKMSHSIHLLLLWLLTYSATNWLTDWLPDIGTCCKFSFVLCGSILLALFAQTLSRDTLHMCLLDTLLPFKLGALDQSFPLLLLLYDASRGQRWWWWCQLLLFVATICSCSNLSMPAWKTWDKWKQHGSRVWNCQALGYWNPCQQLCVDKLVGWSTIEVLAGEECKECSKCMSPAGTVPTTCVMSLSP